MAFTRLPRFRRASEIGPIQLTQRDREIIRLVHRHRFLRSSHIVGLIGGSQQQLLRRLQRLYHHGFLERPRAQIDYFHRGGSRQIVYGVSNKGTRLLQQEHVLSNLMRENDRVIGRLFLEHALLTSDVMVGLELACRRDGRVRLLVDDELPLPKAAHEQREPLQWSVTVSNRTKLGVIPDRMFGLEFTNRPAQRKRAFFFLEADRGTMPVSRVGLTQSSFRRKLLAYEATWKQKLHETRFGLSRFRVLTVTTSAERAKNLASAAAKLERGHGLFLFTDADTFRTHSDVLTLPWETAQGRPPESLFDSLTSSSP
jgi:hypothetical protein